MLLLSDEDFSPSFGLDAYRTALMMFGWLIKRCEGMFFDSENIRFFDLIRRSSINSGSRLAFFEPALTFLGNNINCKFEEGYSVFMLTLISLLSSSFTEMILSV